MERMVQLTDDERKRWLAATTSAQRKAIIREVRQRERIEAHSDANIVESFIEWADRKLGR